MVLDVGFTRGGGRVGTVEDLVEENLVVLRKKQLWFIISPVLDVGFVKLRSTIEHAPHNRDVARVPGLDVLIIIRSTIEHTIYIRDVAHTPGPDVLIELRSIPEHAPHICDVISYVARLPPTYVFVKVLRALEERARVRHLAGIPARDMAVRDFRADSVSHPVLNGLLDIRNVEL